jgi:hypothetical protein
MRLRTGNPRNRAGRDDAGTWEDTLSLKTTLAAATVLSMAALCACNRQDAPADTAHLALTGSKYCTPFPTAVANTNTTGGLATAVASDPAVAFDDCIHRWGYALAPSRDPADVVAQASVEACSAILTSWSQQAMSQSPEPTSMSGGREAQQQPDPMQQRMHAAEGRALFYVVQARAGGCAAPPANTLVSPTANAG